ncbi:MAG TPA: ribosomal protein S18-alanine N-acetyltransferase [Streptosporangiaceae bacterium]|jgi:ribosomal-protein-alanine N-acetyltransferase|nr:ribosomal protein S18-alanine N-acetyltransferase [Streptosporangiaceae bacterium]
MTAALCPVQLRPMTAADLPAVTALEQELFPEDAWTPRMFASELAGVPDSRHYLVAEAAGRIVGYAGLLAPLPPPPGPSRGAGRHEPGILADVATMAVAADHWGRGIGSALLTALLTEAADRGCAEVFLEVRADNPRAQRLYRRHGFTAVGLRRGYYQPSGMDAIVMHRPTDQAPVDQAVSPAPPSTVPPSTAPASGGSRS